MSTANLVGSERVGAVAVIELRRQSAANGLDQQMLDELSDAATACATDPAVRVVVLTAAGRFFCAGGDVRAMADFGSDRGAKTRKLADTLHQAMATLAGMDAPLVVAVNGVTAGGGLGLALIGDFVLAALSASFTMGYASIGLSPDGGSTYLLPRLIGLRRTQQLALTKKVLPADEALEWGLVSQVVPDKDLRQTAMALASSLASGAPSAMGAIKRLLLSSWTADLHSQLNAESEAIGACADTRDAEEGIAAFLEKRAPRFQQHDI